MLPGDGAEPVRRNFESGTCDACVARLPGQDERESTGYLIVRELYDSVQHRAQRLIRHQHLQNPVTRGIEQLAFFQLFRALPYSKGHLTLAPYLGHIANAPGGKHCHHCTRGEKQDVRGRHNDSGRRQPRICAEIVQLLSLIGNSGGEF